MINIEVCTLKHLSDGEQHDEAPKGLTNAQFYVALKSLLSKGMVRAAFEEGGGVVSAQITLPGQAFLDDLKDEEAKKLRGILRQYDITQNQYKLLCYTKENGKAENIFGVKYSEYKKEIWEPIYQKGYLKTSHASDDRPLVLGDKGEDLLQAIDDILAEDQEYLSNIDTNQVEQVSKENVAELPKKTKASDIHVAKGHLADIIKIIQAMCDLNYFVDANGNKATNKSVMDYFSEAFNAKQLLNYSPNLNKASKANKNTYMQTFINLEEQAEKFYNNCVERRLNKA